MRVSKVQVSQGVATWGGAACRRGLWGAKGSGELYVHCTFPPRPSFHFSTVIAKGEGQHIWVKEILFLVSIRYSIFSVKPFVNFCCGRKVVGKRP